jgi:hypothetical protein
MGGVQLAKFSLDEAVVALTLSLVQDSLPFR